MSGLRRDSSNQLNHDPLTHQRRRPLQTRQRDVAFRIENAIDLGAARLQQDSHARLGNLFLLHRLRELPGYDLLDGLRLRFLEDVLFLQEVVNARSHIFLAHCSSSFCRLRASAKSSSGVARVFLMNPRSATRRPDKSKSTRVTCGSQEDRFVPPTDLSPSGGTTA